MEVVNGSGKSFHMEVTQELLVKYHHFSANGHLFKFLKNCLKEARILDVWTQHVVLITSKGIRGMDHEDAGKGRCSPL